MVSRLFTANYENMARFVASCLNKVNQKSLYAKSTLFPEISRHLANNENSNCDFRLDYLTKFGIVCSQVLLNKSVNRNINRYLEWLTLYKFLVVSGNGELRYLTATSFKKLYGVSTFFLVQWKFLLYHLPYIKYHVNTNDTCIFVVALNYLINTPVYNNNKEPKVIWILSTNIGELKSPPWKRIFWNKFWFQYIETLLIQAL